jgi:transcriptional regulator with XRE-family HTH domain
MKLPAPTDPSFPAALREARLSREMTQAELAARVGVSANAVHLWEGGSRRPHREKHQAIAAALADVPHPTELRWQPMITEPPTPTQAALLARVRACHPGSYVPHPTEHADMAGLAMRGLVGWTGVSYVAEGKL